MQHARNDRCIFLMYVVLEIYTCQNCAVKPLASHKKSMEISRSALILSHIIWNSKWLETFSFFFLNSLSFITEIDASVGVFLFYSRSHAIMWQCK